VLEASPRLQELGYKINGVVVLDVVEGACVFYLSTLRLVVDADS
jgi:hypothetical protein